MATPVKYKKPSAFNLVTIVVVLGLVFGGVVAYEYFPLYVLKHEAYRVLEESGSKLASQARLYAMDANVRDKLRKDMHKQLKEIGITDPQMETWVEVEGKQARLGVVYSAWLEWPFDVVERKEKEYELEHSFELD